MAVSGADMAVLAEYRSSLNDLDFNSKPMINMLTMLAEEHENLADGVVKIIKDRILQNAIKIKLPSLYLLDSILKNIGGGFIEIIAKHMTEIFTNVFEKGDEKIRMSLFKLRNTWPQYFPSAFLHELDLAVRELDPNWPVTQAPPVVGSIHINPKFLVKQDRGIASQVDDRTAEGTLKMKMQKERLLAEEQRIQEQLKKLQGEQQRIKESRIEEERITREKILKQKQMERELMIKEQQKQIVALKKLQKEQEASFPLSVKKTEGMKGSSSPQRAKLSDPRLPQDDPGPLSMYAEGANHTTSCRLEDNAERHAGEPVSKKRRPDNAMLKMAYPDNALPTVSRAAHSMAQRKSEDFRDQTRSAKTNLEANRQDELVSIGEKTEKIRQESRAEKDNPLKTNRKSNHVMEEMKRKLDSGDKSKEAHGALANQISSINQTGENQATKGVDVILQSVPSGTNVTSALRNKGQSSLHDVETSLSKNERAATGIDKTYTGAKASHDVTSVTNPAKGPVSTVTSKIPAVGKSNKQNPPTESNFNTVEGKKDLPLADSNDELLYNVREKDTQPYNARKDPSGMEASKSNGKRTRKGREENEADLVERTSVGDQEKSRVSGFQETNKTTDVDKVEHGVRKNMKSFPGELPTLTSRRGEENRHLSDPRRIERQGPKRQGHPKSQIRGRGVRVLTRGRGNRRTPPLDAGDKFRPSEDFVDQRGRRPPWRRVGDPQNTRRNFRAPRGNFPRGEFPGRDIPPGPHIDDNIRGERIPREDEHAVFHRSRRGRFEGPLGGPKRRMINERHESQQRFHMHERPWLREERNHPEGRQYQHDANVDEARMFYETRRHPAPYDDMDEDFRAEQSQSHDDYHHGRYQTQENIPRSHENQLRMSDWPIHTNDISRQDDNSSQPYDRRNVTHGEDQAMSFRNDESLHGYQLSRHSYMQHRGEHEGRFEPDYKEPRDPVFERRLPPAPDTNVETDRRTNQEMYASNRSDYPDLFARKGDASQIFDLVSKSNKQDTAPSSKADDVLEMIKNLTRKSEPASSRADPSAGTTSTQQSTEAMSSGKQLFEGLLPAGVLPSSIFTVEATASPPPTIEATEDEIPELGFVMEDLKIRHDSIINKLYSGTQCGTCGLRFAQEDKKFYSDHHDWHFRNNRIGKDGKKSASRTWYHFKELWIDMDDVTDFEEQAKSAVFELEKKVQDPTASGNAISCSVLSGDEVCGICFEPFEQFWDESLEEWRYNDATRIDGQAYHVNCYDDIGSGVYSDQEEITDDKRLETDWKDNSEGISENLNIKEESLEYSENLSTNVFQKSYESRTISDSLTVKDENGATVKIKVENDVDTTET